jgi:predicted site-specific integrase-resolvase
MQGKMELTMNTATQESRLRLLDLKELAEEWKVSPHTVRLWVRQGRLAPVRICRRLLFRPEECERFLNEERPQA